MKDFCAFGLLGLFLLGCAGMQQSLDGSAHIHLTDGRTAYCPDGVVTTPAAVACYTKVNRGKNIFTIYKGDIKSITMG